MECQRGQNCQTTKIIVKWSRHSQTNIIYCQMSIFKAEIHSQIVNLFTNQKSNLNKIGKVVSTDIARKARKWERKINNLARSSLISSLCSGSPTLHPRRF